MIDGGALRAPASFVKYHALGNDYLVLDATTCGPFDAGRCRQLCHRHYGIGADGVLLRVAPPPGADVALRIFNPDGSEAEKSGNGLRIFLRAMQDIGALCGDAARVAVGGQTLRATLAVPPQSGDIEVEMGPADFSSAALHVAGPPRPLVDVALPGIVGTEQPQHSLQITAVSLGNPHCVVFVDQLDDAQLRQLGPRIERHPWFTQRTNVQFCRVRSRAALDILIWERGAGPTAASGSSSCAAVAAAQRLGLCDAAVRVAMPGGTLAVRRDAAATFWLRGPVSPICWGQAAGCADQAPGSGGAPAAKAATPGVAVAGPQCNASLALPSKV